MSKLDRAIKNLANLIRSTHAEISSPSASAAPAAFPEIMFSRKDFGTLALTGEDAAEFRQVVAEVASAAGTNASKSFVEAQVKEAVLKSLDIQGTIGGQFDQRLTANLDALRAHLTQLPRIWQIYFRVGGLGTQGLPLTMGKVTFCLPDDQASSTFSQSLAGIIDQTQNAEREKAALKEKISGWIGKSLNGKVTAIAKVAAMDSDAAIELASLHLRVTVDVVNFYADLFVPSGLKSQVYMPGEAATLKEIIPAFTQDVNAAFTIQHHIVGPLADFQPERLLSEDGAKLGFPTVQALLSNEKRNKVEELVLAALQLAGRASVIRRREEAFLLYMICVESLFVPKQAGEIAYRLSRRIAYVFGSDLNQRQRITKDIHGLYRKRSEIAHSGYTEVTDSDLSLARFIAKNSVIRILLDQRVASMKTIDELDAWLDEKSLA